ncbi:MAG: gamma-glutamyl-gamma-aminobutyrate hydrolase family protein [Acidobacteria bacterium]|nr:gamma-glutamyl-gamma-aminobutyrate hydrolase family protein [Acidobacteriota bacterium]
MPDHPQQPWLVLRHIEHEHIGTLAQTLSDTAIRYIDVFRGESVPESLEYLGGLVAMGGPMGVYETDRYPFLADEMSLIRSAASVGLPVLGICLGAQLIAAALGAKVYPGPQKEIGWFPVEVTAPADPFTQGLPASFVGFHWHGDTFDLPAGAVRLFRSNLYENQGFRWGSNVLALQFHLEVSATMIADWLDDPGCRAEMASINLDPEVIRRGIPQWAGELERLSTLMFRQFLNAMVGRIHVPASEDRL